MKIMASTRTAGGRTICQLCGKDVTDNKGCQNADEIFKEMDSLFGKMSRLFDRLAKAFKP